MRGAAAIAALMLALSLATPALAEDDDGTCRNGGFPMENAEFGLAVVTGAGRTHLLYDMDGCPQVSARCEKAGEGYVVTGDKVVTGRSIGDYICAYYPSRHGGSAGWVQKSRLRAMPIDAAPPAAAWLGHWSVEGNPELTITRARGELHVEGESFWPVRTPAKGDPPGWPHSGEIDGTLTLRGNHASYDDEDCKIDMTLIGNVLVAADNDNCGGMNVHFNGVFYR